MADILRELLDNGKFSDEIYRSILLGLGIEVYELNIGDWLWSSNEEEEMDSEYSRQIHRPDFEVYELGFEMADILRQLLDNGKLSDETCRSILLGLGKEVDELNISQKKEKVGDWSWSSDEEEEVDPEYSRQAEESQGFDFDDNVRFPAWGISPCKLGEHDLPRSSVSLYGRLGVHCFNFHKGRNLKFLRIPKYNTLLWNLCFSYYITLEVEDLADNSPHTFQTKFTECLLFKDEYLRVFTEICRLKLERTGDGDAWGLFDDKAVHEFYKGPMPKFVAYVKPEDRLRFYEVQEQDILDNDWLRLYSDFALHFFWGRNDKEYKASLPVEITKVLVETFETHGETCLKLKSGNAIFHIRFSAKGRDYISVLRRTTDGKEGHMQFQVNCWRIKQSSP